MKLGDPAFPEIVTLCGSTRYPDDFAAAMRRLTLQGKLVISVGLYGHAETGRDAIDIGSADAPTDVKVMLDELHKRKIDLADAIFVVNPGGYIGSSTRSEIQYAAAQGKRIDYLVPVPVR